ncbi:putative serine/threonine-protein kinase [Pseudocercospora fuligena]|uniref:non-specific serine/threonine protein kinase n=1 Tax=Pseudocercospora fuligena TaxID=685502 RepID=A0A8H6VN29_9PEZI|nr:putative serine/threonine-protein kinase [Pseudocercospora fuligena]KAF7197875.1 putative serine/threonine-protein kinase [Pseudocercospora fuligena]
MLLDAEFHKLDRTAQDNLAELVESLDTISADCQAKAAAARDHAGAKEVNKSKPDISLLESCVPTTEASNAAIEKYLDALTLLLEVERRHGFSDADRSKKVLKEQIKTWKGNLETGRRTLRIASELIAKARTKADLADTFMDHTIDGSWTGAFEFGAGANFAGLWLKLDQNDTIIDQDSANPTPLEAYFANKCTTVSDNHFVGIRAWDSSDRVRYILTLYSPFCANGDLHDMIDKSITSGTPLPEPFLWAAFLQLVEACIIMRDGSLDQRLIPDWYHVIHRDIKPGNIFIDEPGKRFPAYPTLKVADFGLAIETYEGDPNNPSKYNAGSGSAPYRPPEQFNKQRRLKESGAPEQPLVEPRLWEWTNVYAIGVVMYEMYHNWDLIKPEQKYLVPNEAEWDMWNNAVKRSINLQSFIARCIRRRPENRIGLDELYDKLKKMDPLGDLAMGKYLQNAMNGSQPQVHAYDVAFGGSQKYAIGMTYKEPSGFGSSDLSDTDMFDEGGVPVQIR